MFSAIVFAFAWTIIYQTINSLLFLMFLVGKMLAEERLNEMSCNPTLLDPDSLYNQDRNCLLEELRSDTEKSKGLTHSLSS